MSITAACRSLFLCFLLIFFPIRQTTGKVVSRRQEWEEDSCCRRCPILPHIGSWPFNNSIYAPICQYLDDSMYYATLFDKTHRIPVFSQFVIDTQDSERPKSSFDVEPQLVLPELDKNMASYRQTRQQAEGKSTGRVEEALQKYQAIPDDYKDSKFDQGHVNPSKGHGTKSATRSTFTLTNVVPQPPSFNRGCWKNIETATRAYVRKNCPGPDSHRVVVGAIPGSHLMNERVNIPLYMWSYINCSGYIVGFFVPNTNKESIHAYHSLAIFHFLADNVDTFLNGISQVYKASPHDKEGKLKNLLEKSLFQPFEDKALPDSLGCKSNNLKRCDCLRINTGRTRRTKREL